MWALFGFLFATHFGGGPVRTDPAQLSMREEARIVAAERHAPTIRGEPAMTLDAAPSAPLWPSAHGPGAGPYFRPYQPEEYVAQMMSRLQVDKTPLGQATMWIAGSPVQVDARADRFYVRLKLRM